jgi:hypothetical protein
MTATEERQLPSVVITEGGRWCDGAVEGGVRWAPQQLSLAAPVRIGRDRGNEVRLPQYDMSVSGLAVVLSASGGSVQAHVTNRPGAVLFQGRRNAWRFDRADDPTQACSREAILVHDGHVLWLPPVPLEAGEEPRVEGGYWLAFHLPDATGTAAQPQVVGGLAGVPAVGTDLRTRVGPHVELNLLPAQRLILTAVYAESVVPIPGQLYTRPSTWAEVAVMVWAVPEHRATWGSDVPPTAKTIETRVRTLVNRLEKETKTRLPEEPVPLNQRLTHWCDLHLPKSWFDVELAKRLLAARHGRGTV